jgi:GT2 family glycosyltransferase
LKAGVIVLSWNSREFIGDCLDGLRRWEPGRHAYVIDNGSTDGSPEYIQRAYPDVTLACLPTNLGFASANNLGIQRALADGCGVVVLLNNDTVIDEEFIQPCVEILEKESSIGIIGPVIVEGDRPEVVQCRGGRISLWTLDFTYLGQGEAFNRQPRWEPVGYVLGAAMLIRREVIERTGGLDPEYYPAYVEEADLCFRARRMGYGIAVYHGTRVRHLGAKSSGSRETSFRRLSANRFRFGLKHLGAIRFAVASQCIILRVIVHKLREGPLL